MATKTDMEHGTRVGARGRRRLLGWMAGAGVGLAGATLAGRAQTEVDAQASVPGLVGAWLVAVPQPDGTTFLTPQSFFADGGTITQFRSANGAFGASLGSGVWTQTGERSFAFTFTAGEYDGATGATQGTATGQGTVTLDETGDAWSGMGRLSFFGPDGTVLVQTPPSPVRATRIRHLPLA